MVETEARTRAHGISFGAALRVWARVAALSFGGPAGQIAVMHRILVEEKAWVSDRRFLHALNFCMLLPGPEAQQLATYLGWLLHGVRGGLLAGLLFILPGFVAILALSLVYVTFGQTGIVVGLFFGLKAAVVALVLQAVLRLGRRTLTGTAARVIAAVSFFAIWFLGLPFPLIVLAAAALGWLGWARGWPGFAAPPLPDAAGDGSALGQTLPERDRGALCAALVIGFLWLAPVAGLALLLGPGNVFADLARFFSQMAIVTFGGAYAVLAYVAQQAVGQYGWLLPGEMLDGLGLAETTPGPLIMVVEFVGFLAAYRGETGLDPWLAGMLGATLVTYVTFAPSFLWIFLGAPHVERLRDNAGAGAALRAITAAVVGVILNLGLWFALHLIFTDVSHWSGYGISLDIPVLSSLDPAALALVLGAIFAVFRLGAGLGMVMTIWALLGIGWFALRGYL